MSADLVEAYADPELRQRLAAQGLIVRTDGRAGFNKLIETDAERFIGLLRSTK